MPHPKAHRLVVLGSERVGKTAIIEQFIFGNHVIGQGGPPTVGDIYEVCVETEKGTTEKLQVFDTPGALFTSAKDNQYEQDHFLSIADGFLLVYEIPSKSSYELVTTLRQRIALKNKELPIIVLGNKADLNAIREVDGATVQHWARSHSVRAYEVTVMDRDSLKDPFCYVAWRMANPGRQFPIIPSLVATPIKSSLSQQQGQLPPAEKAEKPPPGSAEKRSPAAERSHKPPTKGSDQPDYGGARPYPDDAQFPKHGAALFFADCLSSKAKKQKDGQL